MATAVAAVAHVPAGGGQRPWQGSRYAVRPPTVDTGQSSGVASACLVRAVNVAGQGILRKTFDGDMTVRALKTEIEDASGIPASEQVLAVGGIPLSNGEVLQNHVGLQQDGASLVCGTVVVVRRTNAEWIKSLEEVCTEIEEFRYVQKRLREETVSANFNMQMELDDLAPIAEEFGRGFQVALQQMSDSGSLLLAAAGDLQRNRDTVFEVVPRTSKGCRQAAEELMNCRNKMLASVVSNGKVLAKVNAALAPLHKGLVIALRHARSVLAAAGESFMRENELFQVAQARGWLSVDLAKERCGTSLAASRRISDNGKKLDAVSQSVNSWRTAYRRGVVVNRNAIRQAEASLKRDQEIIFSWSMDHVSDMRKTDREFVMTVIESNGEELERVPEVFKQDKEVVLQAVAQSDGWALQFASDDLQHDREIVMSAVKHNGWILEGIPEEFRNDKEVVMAAVEADGEALEFASDALKNDREVVLTAVGRSGGWALKAAAPSLRADREVALAAIQMNGLVLEHLSEDLRNDRKLVSAAVQANGLALEYAPKSLRQDIPIVLLAVRCNGLALQFAHPELKANHEVVKAAVSKDGYALRYAAQELQDDSDVAMAAVSESGPVVLEFASANVKSNPKMLALIATTVLKSQQPREPGDGDSTVPAVIDIRNWTASRRGPDCVKL